MLGAVCLVTYLRLVAAPTRLGAVPEVLICKPGVSASPTHTGLLQWG